MMDEKDVGGRSIEVTPRLLPQERKHGIEMCRVVKAEEETSPEKSSTLCKDILS